MTNQNQKTKQELLDEAWNEYWVKRNHLYDKYDAKRKPLDDDEYWAKVKPLEDEYDAKVKEIEKKFKDKICEVCGK